MSAGAAPFLSLAPGAVAPGKVWWLRTGDGLRLRAALWPADGAQAHAVLLTGRTEYLEKAAITAAGLVARGVSVISVDWRGQGLSDRLVAPPAKGHIADYGHYQRDLDALLADPAVAELPGPRLMLAHSMGGLIGLAALARPEIASGIRAAVLSAPLLGLALGAPARVAVWLTVRIAALLGRLERWPPLGDVATPYVLTGAEPNVLTSDQAVWAWLGETARAHPEIALAMPSLAWFDATAREAARVRALAAPPCPVHVLVGSDEQVVSHEAILAWAASRDLAVTEVAGGRHEVLIERAELRAQGWTAVDAFLAAQGLARSG